jgi:hypothetical protein
MTYRIIIEPTAEWETTLEYTVHILKVRHTARDDLEP